MNRLSHIDFLRFIAASAVLYQHVVEGSDLDFLKPTLQLAPGVFGVILFFFVSGLVIPFSVKERMVWPDFVIRRIFRIFPNYWFCLALIAGLSALGLSNFTNATAALGSTGWLANLLLLQEFTHSPELLGVAWTLPLEFIWYAIFLAYALTIGRDRIAELSILFSLMMCGAAALSIVAHVRLPLGRVGMIDAALLGYTLFGLNNHLVSVRKFVAAGAAFLFSTTFAEWVSFGYFEHPNISLFNGFSGWLGATMVFLVFTLVRPLRDSRFVNSPVLGRAGEISYSIYLIHPIIMGLHLQIFGRPWIWLCVPVFTVLAATASYRFVEKRGIAVGRSLSRRLSLEGPDQRAAAGMRTDQRILTEGSSAG